nr:MAG TPA: hypothetical protein [Caudoviricetes sp.]
MRYAIANLFYLLVLDIISACLRTVKIIFGGGRNQHEISL